VAQTLTEPKNQIDAVVFDLFGTLVPEFPKQDFLSVLTGMAQILGVDRDQFLRGWDSAAIARQTGAQGDMETSVLAICERLGVVPNAVELAQAMQVRSAMYRRWFHPAEGALETVGELKRRGYLVGLISMCTPDAPAMWRATALAPLVAVAVFSSEVGLRKPDPAIYLYACERLGVAPDRCLYCGDGSYGELTGAAAVGMTPYLIRDREEEVEMLRPEVEDWAGPSISDLRELLALLPAPPD
jgi:putative hydrolase of the HAD superfamily